MTSYIPEGTLNLKIAKDMVEGIREPDGSYKIVPIIKLVRQVYSDAYKLGSSKNVGNNVGIGDYEELVELKVKAKLYDELIESVKNRIANRY